MYKTYVHVDNSKVHVLEHLTSLYFFIIVALIIQQKGLRLLICLIFTYNKFVNYELITYNKFVIWYNFIPKIVINKSYCMKKILLKISYF